MTKQLTMQQLAQVLNIDINVTANDVVGYIDNSAVYPMSIDQHQFDECIRKQQLDRLECIMQVIEFNELQETHYKATSYFAANIEQLIRMVDLGRIDKADNVRLNNEVKTAGGHYLGHLLDQM